MKEVMEKSQMLCLFHLKHFYSPIASMGLGTGDFRLNEKIPPHSGEMNEDSVDPGRDPNRTRSCCVKSIKNPRLPMPGKCGW